MWSAIFVSIAVVLQSTSFASAFPAATEKYGIVLDAGSSGTRIKVYKYNIGRHTPLAPSDVQQVKVPKPDKIKPGISKFGQNVGMIQDYLKQLIDNTKRVVPAQQQPSTPIMLFATAGMRLLPLNQRNAVLSEVERLFSNKSFCPFSYQSGDARIITGDEEAIYGWITLNFLKGRFSPNVNIGTLGALDLGGGSTQNAYRVTHNGQGTPTVTVNLAGKDYPLYVHSYLGYGLSEATDSYYKLLASSSKGSSVVSPCHNKGYAKTIIHNNSQVTIIGGYNEMKCQNLLKKMFFCNGNSQQCPFVNQPKLEGDFFGINAFYYVMKDIGVIQTHGQRACFSKFKKLSHDFCSRSSASLDTSLYDVQGLCFRANYLYEMFKDGYHIDFKTFILHIGRKMSNFDLSWTLGALLYNSNIL